MHRSTGPLCPPSSTSTAGSQWDMYVVSLLTNTTISCAQFDDTALRCGPDRVTHGAMGGVRMGVLGGRGGGVRWSKEASFQSCGEQPHWCYNTDTYRHTLLANGIRLWDMRFWFMSKVYILAFCVRNFPVGYAHWQFACVNNDMLFKCKCRLCICLALKNKNPHPAYNLYTRVGWSNSSWP